MAAGDAIEVEGVVTEALPNTLYWVELPNGHKVLAHRSGKARRAGIEYSVGKKVILEMTPFDLSVGRIRLK